MKKPDFCENLITRGSIYEPFLICVTPSEDPSKGHFFEKMLVQKNVEHISKNSFPEKVRNPFPWTRDT